MNFVLYAVYGCIIGVANIIPGVSGGTMAVILNIYDKLIESVTGIRKHFKESLMFLIPVVIGAGLGIFGFSKLLKYLLQNFPMPTFFFFIGLILGSIPMIFNKALENKSGKKKFNPYSIIPFAVFFGIMIALSFFQENDGKEAVVQLELNFINWLYLFFGSALAAMCMIIPGVSGSMILMILGLYSTVLGAIADILKNFANSVMILIPVGLGVLLGILGGAKLIDVCIKKFPQMTFAGILGLMLGSLLSIYNNSGFALSLQGIIAVFALIAGFTVAFIFGNEKLKDKFTQNKKADSKKTEK